MVTSAQDFLESWKGQLVIASLYVMYLALAAHALLGVVRTISVKYPARHDEQGFVVPLFSGDYTYKLYSWSGWWARLGKVTILAVQFILFAPGLIMTLLWWMINTDYVWLEGWNEASAPYVSGAHLVFILLVLFLAARRGYTYAIHWSRPPRTTD